MNSLDNSHHTNLNSIIVVEKPPIYLVDLVLFLVEKSLTNINCLLACLLACVSAGSKNIRVDRRVIGVEEFKSNVSFI